MSYWEDLAQNIKEVVNVLQPAEKGGSYNFEPTQNTNRQNVGRQNAPMAAPKSQERPTVGYMLQDNTNLPDVNGLRRALGGGYDFSMPGTIEYKYKPGDSFGKVLLDLKLTDGSNMWGEDGDVRFYQDQLRAQGFNGNLPVGSTIKLIPRKLLEGPSINPIEDTKYYNDPGNPKEMLWLPENMHKNGTF